MTGWDWGDIGSILSGIGAIAAVIIGFRSANQGRDAANKAYQLAQKEHNAARDEEAARWDRANRAATWAVVQVLEELQTLRNVFEERGLENGLDDATRLRNLSRSIDLLAQDLKSIPRWNLEPENTTAIGQIALYTVLRANQFEAMARPEFGIPNHAEALAVLDRFIDDYAKRIERLRPRIPAEIIAKYRH